MSLQKKILIAEDDSSMRNFLALTLTRAGFEVTSAEDGSAAFEMAMANDFDAVVADDVMPHMTGHDLCRMLRGNEKTSDIPFIILSGREEAFADENIAALANAQLLKTVNLKDELVDILTELLQPALTSA
ncbi:MAG TPA: response regulator [Pyrinomonadaceae bacterium]|jgi:DNA-binding response OmpR family regulator|nr:response regulator [Pyrinomonadaceae bacterium]